MSSGHRGIRNNNPGNIEFDPRNDWQGQAGLEQGVAHPRFARFDSAESGIRALARLLINYRSKEGQPDVGGPGIDTVREIISRWAPGNENDTEAYIRAVARAVGVGDHEPVDIRDPQTLTGMVTAIITHENASNPYSPATVAEGIRRAME
jgi:hypothetical protein